MNTDHLITRRLSDAASFSFDCGNKDLNDFLLEEAVIHDQAMLTRTYLVYDKDILIAYFSLSNDKISSLLTETGNTFRRVSYNVPKVVRRYREFPAIKISRLAVDLSYQRQGIGTFILYKLSQQYLFPHSFTGARFITVDATNESLDFYTGVGFRPLPLIEHQYATNSTTSMYIDLVDITVTH